MATLTFKKIEGITAGTAFTVNAFASDETVEATAYFACPNDYITFTKFTPKISSVKVGGQNWLSTEIIKITYEIGIWNSDDGFTSLATSGYFPTKSHQVSEKDGTVSSSVTIDANVSYDTTPSRSEYIVYKIKIESTQNLVGCKVVMSGFELSADYTVHPTVVAAKCYPTDGGTVTGNGTYQGGATVTLKATPNKGYVFKRWENRKIQINGEYPVLGTDTTYKFTAYGTCEPTAVFEYVGINNIYIGTSKPKEIYIGTSKVKSIYVGTTKVYG